MKFLLRAQLTVLVTLLVSCATPKDSGPWYVGEFLGTTTSGTATQQWSVKCSLGEKCAVSVKQPGRPDSKVQTVRTRVPTPYDTAIPNNNLDFTRRATFARPELYQDQHQGPSLTPLREILQSKTTFNECVDIGEEIPGDFALCSLSTDPTASKSLVLLFNTMNGRCGTQAFCAYYFQALGRVRSQ